MKALLIALFVCAALANDYINIPVEVTVVADGHYNAGYEYGKQTSKLMKDYFYNGNPTIMKSLDPFYNTPKGKEISEKIFENQKNAYPEYMEEIEGMAVGSGIPSYLIKMFTLVEEFSYVMPKQLAYSYRDHCSDQIVNEHDFIVLAHNEDGSGSMDFNNTVLVHMTIKEGDKIVSQFSSFSYIGQLPTAAYGWNKDIVLSMNYLHTDSFDIDGLSRSFVARELLDATSISEALRIISKKNYFVGHNYQLAPVNKGEKGTVINFEAAPFARFGYYEATPAHPHFHANMYNVLICDDTYMESSVRRQNAAAKLPIPNDMKSTMIVLGDESDPDWQIYNPTTLNTMVYNYIDNTIDILIGNPKNYNVWKSFHL
ncbi:hypothetical protein WA158_005620 [Blastocystis sp. Blastoise]